MVKLVAKEGGIRLDAFIAQNSEFSRSHIKKITDDGLVKVNGVVQKGKYTVKIGDAIEFFIPEAKPLEVKPVNLPR